MVLLLSAALILLRLLGELWLSALNRAEVRRNADTPPASTAAIMDAATYKRSVSYTLDKSRFGSVAEVFDTGVLVLVLFGGILPRLFGAIGYLGAPEAVWDDALFIVATVVLLSIPGLPFDWWLHFRLEERHGFNKTTQRLWLSDKIKGFALGLAIGFPVIWGLLVLVRTAGPSWWIWGFLCLFGVQLLLMVLYPKLILPLFNKLTPLPEGELRERLLGLAGRTGFRARTIEVIDGSRRSGHSNAYFTGFGRFRRIVLYDTLIAQLSPEELEAVLAHEIGHYRRGHVPKMLAVGAAMQLAGFALIAWLAGQYWFNTAFGLPALEIAPTFVLVALLSGAATFWLSPLLNSVSRKHEYEADAFAREAVGGAAPMIGALRKLAKENLSNLTPHPWFSAFYYSHPTIAERERSLQA